MPEHPKFIVVFKDGVTKDQISDYVTKLTDNGGKVKDNWFTQDKPILNGFSAAIPENYLRSFKSFSGDSIASIEPDGVMWIQ
ncbi:serine proteinase inhibitor IA-1 [Crepidotus variabilis]|uniref:Serine proteinase inhibitor IA-1 n=1 Tax=Crepidotus variabilis TaxID=179855 RepID=A0A9P6JRE5_9AGAR|nr:serine proteinase inhibitor IA-1 [Crepidotus variabilis]